MVTFEQFGPAGNFYEAPRWHENAWWVSDFYAHKVLKINVDGRSTTVAEVEGQPGGLGWLPDGSLLVVSMRDQRVLHVADGQVSVYAELGSLFGGWANDMCVTTAGYAYVGNFGFDLFDPDAITRRTCLAVIAPDGSVRVAADNLAFPNACMETPDGRELVVNETLAGCHTAFTIAADGSLGNRRTWARIGTAPADPDHALADLMYGPDGACFDADGRLWVADAFGQRVLLLEEGGHVSREVRLPDGLNAYACCVGGTSGRTLLVAAAPDHDAQKRSSAAEGVLLVSELDASGPDVTGEGR